MSFTGAFGLVMLGIVAIALLGPSKLPSSAEHLWLMFTNFRLSQSDLPPLTLEQARRSWEISQNPLYDLIQILYASVEHLVELRHRLFVVLGTLAVGALAATFVANKILDLLVVPAGGAQLIVLRPTDMVWTYLEVILSVAVVVTLPVMLFEVLMFIRPALETTEELSIFRGIAIVGMPLVGFFFLLGLAFAYFVMLPFALKYLQSFGADIAEVTWNIREYYSFVLTVLMWIGAAFETPLVMAVLSRLGLVSPQAMLKQWRYATVGGAIVAAAITPTVDPFNMMLVMVPLMGLYFTGVLMARAVYRPRRSQAAGVIAS